MNAQLSKEIRLLLPAWCAAVGLVVLVMPLYWIPQVMYWLAHGEFHIPADHYRYTGLYGLFLGYALTVCLILGVLFLGVSSFGREFARHTFQLFLSQPISRDRLWRDKVTVLGVATVTLWLIFWLGFSVRYGFSVRVALASLTVCLAIAGTGLWTTLLFRQIMPAFCFSLLLPAFLVPALSPVAERGFPVWMFAVVLVLSIVYSVAAYCFARRLFLRAQDLDPWLEDLSLIFSRTQKGEGSAPRSRNYRRRPIGSLMVKEFHLHQVNLIGGVVTFLVLGLWAILVAGGDRTMVQEGVHITFIFACLVMPVLAGSVAIAEERKLGVFEAQQCFPVSRWGQFLVKLAVTIGAIIILGIALPLVVFWAVALIGGMHLAEGDLDRLMGLVKYAVWAGAVAFYASSLFRSTLGALAFSIGVLFFTLLVLAVAALWPGFRLFALLALPLGSIVLILLAARNFREAAVDSRVRMQNIRLLSGAVVGVFLLTSLVFYRTWELVLPEPTIGPPVPGLSDGAVAYATDRGEVVLLLPDGRLWMADPGDASGSVTFPGSGAFLGEPGWTDVALSWLGGRREDGGWWSERFWVGLRDDGTLWRILEDFKLEPLASGTRWVNLAEGIRQLVGVREDGTLWRWGTNQDHYVLEERIEEPVQIGNDADWVRVYATDYVSTGVRRDGSVWFLGDSQPERWHAFPEGELMALEGRASYGVARLADGTLWGWAWENRLEPYQVGNRSDWKAAVTTWDAMVALREDGTLWGDNFRGRDQPSRMVNPTERLSRHSEWVAISRANHRSHIYALTTDGSWWVWESNHRHFESLLAPSRWPRRLGE